MNRQAFLYYFQHARQVGKEPDYPLNRTGRPAAVLIPLIERGEGLSLLLTERAHHLRHHPGQISFPGGAVEESDETIIAAALRETQEETGISSDYIHVIGTMPDYRTISGYTIKPVIAFVTPGFTLKIDANEVASVFEVPFAHVMDKKNHLVHYTHRDKNRFPIYFIPYKDKMIWGATAAMLRNLSHHLDISHHQ